MVLVTSIMVTALLDLTAALLCGVVAQQVRASDCRSEGCEFEPRSSAKLIIFSIERYNENTTTQYLAFVLG